jgi:hypothetical protein
MKNTSIRNVRSTCKSLQVTKSRVCSTDILGIAFVGSCSGINFAWSFPHSVQPGWSQHPAYPADGSLSFSSRLRVRQSSRRLGWQSRHRVSVRCWSNCESRRTMPKTYAPFGLPMQTERVGAIWRMNLDRRTRDKPNPPPLRKATKERPPGKSKPRQRGRHPPTHATARSPMGTTRSFFP